MPTSRLNFADLFREHYPRVYRYVRYRVDNDMISEDLTAEIFERAYRYRETYDATRSSFGTWITRIAHNWVNNYFASQQRKTKFEADPHDEELESLSSMNFTPEEHVIRSEAIQQLLSCLDQLSPRDREIVALRFGMDTRNKEIAVLLNLKEHTVSVILLRTLERLRTCQEAG